MTFNELLSKTDKRQPLTIREKIEMNNLIELMRPYIPYDENHPGYDSLTNAQQRALLTLNEKVRAKVVLITPEKEEFQLIKDLMNDPIPVDENHPGWKNLSQKEKRSFKNLKARDEAYGDLAPD